MLCLGATSGGTQSGSRGNSHAQVIVLLVVLSLLMGGGAIFLWQRYSGILRRQVCCKVLLVAWHTCQFSPICLRIKHCFVCLALCSVPACLEFCE